LPEIIPPSHATVILKVRKSDICATEARFLNHPNVMHVQAKDFLGTNLGAQSKEETALACFKDMLLDVYAVPLELSDYRAGIQEAGILPLYHPNR
jgi:hypothetical protein